MTIRFAAIACGLFAAGTALGFSLAAGRSKYADEVYGFSLEVPRFSGQGPATPGIIATFLGPSVAGFSDNVNVLAQVMKTTRKAFRELTLDQIKQANLTLVKDVDRTVSGRDAIEAEYEGRFGNRTMHFLALSVIEDDRVLVITCTSTPEAFPAVEAEFRACLASFKLRDAR